MSLFEQRLARVELAMGNLVDKVEDSEKHIEELGEELCGEMQGALNQVANVTAQREDALEALVNALHRELDEMKGELAVCKTAMTQGTAIIQPTRVDVPKPKELKGQRSAKEVDNFIRSMEQYFGALGVFDNAIKV